MKPSNEQQKPRVTFVDRKQMIMISLDIDKLVDADHLARAIWDFIDELDLSEFYNDIRSLEGEAGRSAFDPRLLICLLLYAYTQGEGRAREISRLCEFHPAYQWTTGMQSVNYHTLSSFRIRHKEKLDRLFKQSLAMFASEGLIDLNTIFQDGSKIHAAAASDSFHRRSTVQENLKKAEEVIEQLQKADSSGGTGSTERETKRAIKRRERVQRMLQEFEKLPDRTKRKKEVRISQTDPDARIMITAGGATAPAYNAQVCVEAKNGFIASTHISQSSSDFQQLEPAIEKIFNDFGVRPKNVVVDSGFTSKTNIIKLNAKGIRIIGPLLPQSVSAGQFDMRGIDPLFRTKAFVYNSDGNFYQCPAGKTLSYAYSKNGRVSLEHVYRASTSDCRSCLFKEKCLGKKSKRRSIVRSQDVAAVADFKRNMETPTALELYKQRSYRMEFVFAWLKDKFGLRKFRLRGQQKVAIELLWSSLAFNIQLFLRLRVQKQAA